ncbi:MAG TPA: DUF362 domain-containing protein [Bacillota bacterium]|nr:DUF362 domain-containing protein [Bacillota bacterium]
MDNKVYIVRCPDYAQAAAKLEELMALMGGMSQFAAAQEKILLKVNLLQPAKPEQAVSTHPEVIAAIARMAKQTGAVPLIADSPGSGYKYTENTLKTLYQTCQIFRAAEAAGVQVNLDTTYELVSFPQGKLIKHFEVITPVLKANGIFNLCKLKTHLYMGMTGAVKNNFGVIPGLAKVGYHAKLHDKEHFAGMLLDLAEYVAPRLSIMDAITGMEGEGPGASGTPRQIGLLIGSRNPLALDVVAAEIIGLPRDQNPVLLAAAKRGLGPTRIEEVEVEGVNLPEILIPDFRFPRTVEGTGLGSLSWWQKLLKPIIKNGFSLTPRIVRKKCIGCGICRDSCPVKTITVEGNGRKYARINTKNCIRCYCCHELCPKKAVELNESLVYRMVNR